MFMGLILIIIGIIIQMALGKSSPDSADYFENTSRFMINPMIRLLLGLLSWILIIMGVIRLFS